MDNNNIFLDWKFWTFILSLLNGVGIVCACIFNKLLHDKLVSNDLFHINKKVDDLSEEQVCIKNKVIKLAEDVSYLRGKIEI